MNPSCDRFYPSMASVSTHFTKYRATALGLVAAGSSVGKSAHSPEHHFILLMNARNRRRCLSNYPPTSLRIPWLPQRIAHLRPFQLTGVLPFRSHRNNCPSPFVCARSDRQAQSQTSRQVLRPQVNHGYAFRSPGGRELLRRAWCVVFAAT